ncbi:universal stress protein [Haloflavibacter putidus]|uniref:Universal stress protein n=1 Tax=Haloflavibacter putidus TaxID=2576776 RepID=A0A507ZSV8_9FLAO|nr:universal stress protein [Haloflavibacter putidus]TQD39603.1 universal stress protein [Haloflavibacter putidus]
MKRILVPTDFSTHAENALKVAAQIAKKNKAEIFLLHMLELPLELMDPTTQQQAAQNNPPEALFFMKLAHKRFNEIMEADFLEEVTVHETVQFHQAFEGIMEVAEDKSIDLIVMGSQGATGLKEVFIGSNTEKVVRNSNIPVLVIKEELPIFDVENFVYASEFEEKNKKSFKEAVDFSKSINAKLHLVYVNTANKFQTSESIENRIKTFLKEVDLENYSFSIYNDNTIEEGILNFARKTNAGLVGISTHGRKGLAHMLNGSISEDLVNHADIPVITFKL